MKNVTRAAALAAAAMTGGQAMADDSAQLRTSVAKFAYMIGLQVGQNLGQQGIDDIDPVGLVLGVQDALEGKESRLTQEEVQAAIAEVQQAREARLAAQAEAATARGEAFLAENGQRDGVVTTASGLQYKIITAGEGAPPTPERQVSVHYTGRLLDGTVFDSSVERGTPATFPVRGVIQGWQEALQLMSPGASWDVWIPSHLAYGPQGAGGDIGPNETLHFSIDLIEIIQ